MGYFEDKAYIDSYLSRVSNRYYTKSDLLQRNEARYLAEIKDLKKSIQFKGGSLGLILSWLVMKNISPGKALLPTLVMIYLGKEAGLYIFLEQFKKAIEVIEQK